MSWLAALSSIVVCIPAIHTLSPLRVQEGKSPVAAVTLVSHPDVLQGLTSVKVMVEDLAPDMKPLGLSKDGLRRAVEERLQAKGVQLSSEAHAKLYVRVTTVANDELEGVHGYQIEVKLLEPVSLHRRPTLVIADAVVWDEGLGLLGITGNSNMAAVVKQDVLDLTDRFIRAKRLAGVRFGSRSGLGGGGR